MKLATILLLGTLSGGGVSYATAYDFAFDGDSSGIHNLQGQGIWQDKAGAQGSYLVSVRIEHLSEAQALMTATYVMPNRTIAESATFVRDANNPSFFNVLIAGEKAGEGYCFAIGQEGAKSCHIECAHDKTLFEGTILVTKNRIERMGSMVLPSGRKVIMRDSLNVVQNTGSLGLEGGQSAKEPALATQDVVPAPQDDAQMGDAPAPQNVGGKGQLAQDQGQLAQDQGQLAQDQGQLAQDQGQLVGQDQGQLGAQGKGQLAQDQGLPAQVKGPIAQDQGLPAQVKGPIAQDQGLPAQVKGPIAQDQGPVAQGKGQQNAPVMQAAPMVKGQQAGKVVERRRSQVRVGRQQTLAQSSRAQIRAQLLAQQQYLRGQKLVRR